MNIATSIKQKLRFGFLGIVLLAALGSGYSFYLIQKSKDYIGYKEQVSTILLKLKDARVAEKNFILHERKTVDFLEDGKSTITENHQHSINSINEQIDTIIRTMEGKDIMLHTQLLSLKSTVNDYSEDFDMLKALYQKRGFKDHGLEGSMRGNVHDLQECLSAEEKVFAYSLRRHEKDFMLRKDLKYHDRLKTTAEEFQLFVARSSAPHMTAEYKSHTIKVIDKYLQKFNQLVSLEKEIGLSELDGISGQMNASAEELIPLSEKLFQYVDDKSTRLQSEASMFLFGSILLTVIIGLMISIGMDRTITKPLLLLNKVIQDEISGKSNKASLEKIKSRDEIGTLTTNFKTMMSNLDTQMQNISEANKALEISSEEDRQRKWVAEGVSSFIDLMKYTNENITEISYKIISGMVNYIEANQGGIFFIDDLDDPQKMHLAASYAYSRRKFLVKEVIRGEGLIGAVWIEKQTVTISDIPEKYISISSGLGDARPDKLIIVPIKNDDKVFGVIEMASFKNFKTHHIELIEKTCNGLAAAFESLKVQEKTKNLLQTSQMQAEELKAQEEEMRQNLEEMAATQEDYSRREQELNYNLENLKKENKELRDLLKEAAVTIK